MTTLEKIAELRAKQPEFAQWDYEIGVRLDNYNALLECVEALQRLEQAAFCRDSVMGDPSRLLEVKWKLDEEATKARAALAKLGGE